MNEEEFAALRQDVADMKILLAAAETARLESAKSAVPTRMPRSEFDKIVSPHRRMEVIRGGCAVHDE